MSSLAVEAWVARCADRLSALNADGPLDDADWGDIAADLHQCLQRLPPEWAAETYVGTR